ncbi:hypothetical protein YC2023_078539 [Brassica napus]
MSAQKIQLASLILTFFLLFSQTTGKCNYRRPHSGTCKKGDDCKNVCTLPSEDPTFLACLTGPPFFAKYVTKNNSRWFKLKLCFLQSTEVDDLERRLACNDLSEKHETFYL